MLCWKSPDQITSGSHKKRIQKNRHTTRTPGDSAGSGWSPVCTCQGMPRTAGNYQETGKGKGR